MQYGALEYVCGASDSSLFTYLCPAKAHCSTLFTASCILHHWGSCKTYFTAKDSLNYIWTLTLDTSARCSSEHTTRSSLFDSICYTAIHSYMGSHLIQFSFPCKAGQDASQASAGCPAVLPALLLLGLQSLLASLVQSH